MGALASLEDRVVSFERKLASLGGLVKVLSKFINLETT